MPPRPKRTSAAQIWNASEGLRALTERLQKQIQLPNIYGYTPHEKQSVFHNADDHFKMFLGGNRSGKTYAGVTEDVIHLTKNTNFRKFDYSEPTRGRVVAVDMVRGVEQIILPYVKQFLPSSALINGSWEDSYHNAKSLLTLADGATCEFMSYEQSTEKFAGTSRHFIHYDEEPPMNIYNECQARLIDTDGFSWLTMTPVEGATWVFDKIYDLADMDPLKEFFIQPNIELGIAPAFRSPLMAVTIVEVGMNENPFLSKTAQERYLSTLDEDERKARSKGTFISVGGKVFKTFTIETHTFDYEVNPAELQRAGWQIYTSTDHGWANPSAWLWHAVSHEDQVITFGEIYMSEKTVEELSEMVHRKEALWGLNTEEIVRTGDPAMHQHSGITGTTVIQEYAKRGLPIYTESVPRDPAIGIDRMQMYFKIRSNGKPNWTISKECPNLITELRKLQFKKYASKKIAYDKNKQEEVHKKDDHAFDSAKYFATFLGDLAPEAPAILEGASPVNRNTMPKAVDRGDWEIVESFTYD